MQSTSRGAPQGGQRGMVPAKGEALNAVDVFKEALKRRSNELALLIPRRIRRDFSPLRIVVVAVHAYRAMIVNAKEGAPPPDVDSTIEAVMRMAQLGLEAGTEQAYLVPYKGKVQPIVGPRGYVDLALRHPKMRTCVARTVLAGDVFDHDLGTSTITHKRGHHSTVQAQRAAALEYAWAKYETVNGGTEIEVLTREDVEFYRGFSAARNGPWQDNYEGMARKTALKRVLAYAPRDTFLSLAMAEDEGGNYAPGLSTEEVRDVIDAGDFSTSVQMPVSLPVPRPSAVEHMGEHRAAAEIQREEPAGREPGEEG